jgi:hypothetical protein
MMVEDTIRRISHIENYVQTPKAVELTGEQGSFRKL